ncbi:hypothetical protein VTO42DRAFT_8397 [Malbranchea cinnamomea]
MGLVYFDKSSIDVFDFTHLSVVFVRIQLHEIREYLAVSSTKNLRPVRRSGKDRALLWRSWLPWIRRSTFKY